MSNVLLVTELKKGSVTKASLTALSFARQAATRNGGQVHAIVMGSGIGPAAEEIAKYVSVVHSAEHEAFAAGPVAESYAKAIAQCSSAANASVVCMAATFHGKDVLPRVGALLNAGVGSDVLGFVDDNSMVVNREILAGNVIASVEIATDVKCFTTRPTEFEAAPVLDSVGEIKTFAADLGQLRTKFLKFDAVVSERPALSDARVIIAGGRGLKEAENFSTLVEPMADKLNAAIGASRAVVDAGWVANDLQVGQTGKVVAPELYFAVGISGAIQHVAGMKSSKVIVAINKDPEAPIFQVADYGLVQDLFKAVPELIEKL
jgi:electron transfer flavoprotein alpha subunit